MTENPGNRDFYAYLQNSLFLPSRDNIEKQDGAEAPTSLHTALSSAIKIALSDPVRELNSSLCQPFTTGLKALIHPDR